MAEQNPEYGIAEGQRLDRRWYSHLPSPATLFCCHAQMANNPKTETISGEAIIEAYHSGDIDATITYGKFCKAIDLLSRWQPQAVVEFLEQFVEIASLLDFRCRELVQKFARIEWLCVPNEIRPRFVKMMRDIGVQHICHTETIIRCIVDQFFARIHQVLVTVKNEEDIDSINAENTVMKFALRGTAEEQENIYKLAHDGLIFLIHCLPVATRCFVKIIQQCFPHHSIPSIRYVSYVRNLILICENIRHCRADIFSILIDGLSQLDAVLSKTENSNTKKDDSDTLMNVFFMDEEVEKKVNETQENSDRVEKLDICMYYMLAYIAKAHGQEIPTDIDCSWLPEICHRERMFDELLGVFEEHLLMAYNLKNVPFIWFYLCSLDTNYQTGFLNWLWGFITRLNQAPNDWKKAQGAACYIGSMLSRASYVDISTATEWLEKLSNWCTAYVNEMVDRTAGGGGGAATGTARHGTFYAVFEACLRALCFRYRELIQANEMDKIRRWGLGHIAHSTLEPLSFISYPVAQCFASISRSMQLVYVIHITPTVAEEKLPFEPHFPFDSFYLSKSLPFIATLTRKFSPLSEDVNPLRSEILWKNANEEMDSHTLKQEIGSWEFLGDLARDRNELGQIGDAEVMDFTEGISASIKAANEFLTVYASSPGLKQFQTSHFAGIILVLMGRDFFDEACREDISSVYKRRDFLEKLVSVVSGRCLCLLC